MIGDGIDGVGVRFGVFALDDSDALDNVVLKVLGEDGYQRMKRETASMPKGVANDKIVDEVFRRLNHPFVRLALWLAR